jgi:ribonuclease HII
MILGIDEVGRGPWAGPLVVGAVVLTDTKVNGLADSKKLSKKQRESLSQLIYQQAAAYSLGWVSAMEIDEIGLSAALQTATQQAVEQIKIPYHEIIIDGTVNFLANTGKSNYVTTLKKADQLIASVSAASVIAKVARDYFMYQQDEIYPGYGFKNNVGYGTAEHIAAINKLGVTPLHRLSFAPLAKYQHNQSTHSISYQNSSKISTSKTVSTTKQIGTAAETSVADYLKRCGHQVLNRNWKTKYCEIDIISQRGDTIYFTEVKYRHQSSQGGGLEAITSKKLRQMKFAAECFSASYKLDNIDLQLAVASVTSPNQLVEAWFAIDRLN